jgi:CheY-like chemotaxis protein
MLNEPTRVLIVDGPTDGDDPIDTALTTAGYATRLVMDDESALDVLDTWRPAAVVVDLRLPDRAGHRFCAALARQPGGRDLPVVLMGEISNLLKATSIVPAGLVTTPVDGDLLVAAVRRVAGRAGPD